MMTRIIMMFLSCLAATAAMAQQKVFDRLVLMDGNTVEGRITVQHPGRDLTILQDGQEKTYQMDDVLAIERVTRAADDLSGIDDVIVTRGGKSYKGQIVKQLLGRALYLQDDGGEVQIIKNDDIACQRKEKANPDQPLFEQTPFLDVVVTETGRYQGIIVLQDYGSETTPSFLRVEDADGQQQQVEIAAITEMRRIPNEQYTPVKDFRVADDEVYFNRTLVERIPVMTEEDGGIVFPYDTTVVATVGSPLVIETKDIPEHQQGILVRAAIRKWKKGELLTVSFRDMILSPVVPSSTTTVKQILHREYQLSSGLFVYFIPEGQKIYVCEVK